MQGHPREHTPNGRMDIIDDPHEDGDLWPGHVGFNVGVPYVQTEGGQRLMGPSARKPWAADLEQHARQLHESARAVLQDEREDWAGTPQASAMVWCDADVDIPAMRGHLHKGGYYVRMASIYYDPPIA